MSAFEAPPDALALLSLAVLAALLGVQLTHFAAEVRRGAAVAAALLGGLTACSLAACADAPVDGEGTARATSELPDAYPIRTSPVLAVGEATAGLEISGTVVSEERARPSFKTGGVLTSVRADAGDRVRRGQTLATVDATQVEAGVAQAEAALAKAERDLARAEALFADSVATRAQRDDAATAAVVAREQLTQLSFDRGRLAVSSPIDGRVAAKLHSVGETVGPGQPIFVIQGTGPGDWRVRAALTDAQWARTRVGDAAEVRFDAYPERIFAAAVEERATVANAAGGTFDVKLALSDAPPDLAEGLLARVTLSPTGASADSAALAIPLSALGRVSGKRAEVFVFDGGRARRREVALGQFADDRVEVLSGLSPADVLVTTGVAWLRDGDAVQRTDR